MSETAPIVAEAYRAFRALDGSHPLRGAVPQGYVDYRARVVPGSEIVYFNHALAREMGLVPPTHPDRMNAGLRRALLDTFPIRIVNEHESRGATGRSRGTRGPYMATRYLQMQHPGRNGKTSGDGRGVWLGSVTSGGTTWDVSACGTGSTRLCPATAWTGRFYKTGSRVASYGCGTASVYEGLAAAIMSESFRLGGIPTERVLAVVALPDGLGVTVRAYPSLVRPAHFLVWLKQRDLDRLRGVAELFWERQVSNGAFPTLRGNARWHHLARWVARSFARAAATFESEYVFCWLEWDGDNVLMDGAVLDYGSVRQFGLFHREYRYDDGPVWSTTIPEQRRKARGIAMSFAQIRDALATGRVRPRSDYGMDPVLRLFDEEFDCHMSRLTLLGAGFPEVAAKRLLARRGRLVETFRRERRWFENASASRRRPVPDGITRDAIYSTRDLLRELPLRLLQDERTLSDREILGLAASTYATRRHRVPTRARSRHAHAFQRSYLALVAEAARLTGATTRTMLEAIAARSSAINRRARITGDACIAIASRLARSWRGLGCDGVHEVLHRLTVEHAPLANAPDEGTDPETGSGRRVLEVARAVVGSHRHGL